jgi:hypothetical protein
MCLCCAKFVHGVHNAWCILACVQGDCTCSKLAADRIQHPWPAGMGENASLMPPRYGSSLVPFFPRNSARRDPAPACQIVNVPTAYHLQMLPRVVCNFYVVSKLSVSKRNKQGGHVYLVFVDQGLDFKIITPAVLQIFS